MDKAIVEQNKVNASPNRIVHSYRKNNDPETFEDDYLDDEEVKRPRGKNLKKFKHPSE